MSTSPLPSSTRRPGGRAAIRAMLASAGCVILAGCYSYIPIEPSAAVVPMRVRAQISPRASAELTPVLGVARHTLDGELVERTADGFYIVVSSGEASGLRPERLTQKLLIGPADLLGMQRRELDRTRTIGIAGLAVSVVALVALKAFEGQSGETPDVTPIGGAPEVRLPLGQVIFR